MGSKTKNLGGEIVGFSEPPRRHKALRVLIAGQLCLASVAALFEHESSAGADVHHVAAQQFDADEKAQMLALQRKRVMNSPKYEVMQELDTVGLDPVPAPAGINHPEQFLVTSDQECVAQFGITDAPADAVNVTTYFIGTRKAMTDPELYSQDGINNKQTMHAEGEPSFGVDVPVTAQAQYILDQTIFYCDLLKNHQ